MLSLVVRANSHKSTATVLLMQVDSHECGCPAADSNKAQIYHYFGGKTELFALLTALAPG